MTDVAPARYFVVKAEPLEMTPGLHRLGHDFGNGARDALYFQKDRLAEHYRSEKQRILTIHPERLQALRDEPALSLQGAAFDWMSEALERQNGRLEHRSRGAGTSKAGNGAPGRAPHPSAGPDFRGLSLAIQEDFALMQCDEDGADRLVLLSVCFPSGWRPELLLGASFESIHAPVPAFEAVTQKRRQLVRAMCQRGPYVRFVWTLTADGRLDHHPDDAPRDPWTAESQGFLRIERQVTVPFPAERGSLFLIRTYLYPLAELSLEERIIVEQAVRCMPEAVRAYKGLDNSAVIQSLSGSRSAPTSR